MKIVKAGLPDLIYTEHHKVKSSSLRAPVGAIFIGFDFLCVNFKDIWQSNMLSDDDHHDYILKWEISGNLDG